MINLYYYWNSKIIVRYAKKVYRKTKLKILGENVILQHHQQQKMPDRYTVVEKNGIFLQTIRDFPNFDDEKPF